MQLRIVADDLSRVKDVSRIENPLHFAKDLVERSDLPGQERRAAQAVGLSAADGAADGDDLRVKLLRGQPHPLDVGRIVEVQERLEAQLSLARVAKQRSGDLPPLQHVLHADEERGERFRRDGHVFEHGRRPARPLDAVKQRLRRGPAARTNRCRPGRRPSGAPAASRFCWKMSSTMPCVRRRTSTGSSPSYSTRSRASVSAGIKTFEADFAFAGETHVAAVHQVARRRLRRQDLADGAGGVVQAFEQQEDDAAMPRQGLRGQRRLGDQDERPFRARDSAARSSASSVRTPARL